MLAPIIIHPQPYAKFDGSLNNAKPYVFRPVEDVDGSPVAEFIVKRRKVGFSDVDYFNGFGFGSTPGQQPVGVPIQNFDHTLYDTMGPGDQAFVSDSANWTVGASYQIQIRTKNELGVLGPFSDWRLFTHSKPAFINILEPVIATTDDPLGYVPDISWKFEEVFTRAPQEAYRVVIRSSVDTNGANLDDVVTLDKPIVGVAYDSGLNYSSDHFHEADFTYQTNGIYTITVYAWYDLENNQGGNNSTNRFVFQPSFTVPLPLVLLVDQEQGVDSPVNHIRSNSNWAVDTFTTARLELERQSEILGDEWQPVASDLRFGVETGNGNDGFLEYFDGFINSGVGYFYRARVVAEQNGVVNKGVWRTSIKRATPDFGWMIRDWDNYESYFKPKTQASQTNRKINSQELMLAGQPYALNISRRNAKGPLSLSLTIRIESSAEEKLFEEVTFGKRLYVSNNNGEGWVMALTGGNINRKPLLSKSDTNTIVPMRHYYLMDLTFIEVDPR